VGKWHVTRHAEPNGDKHNWPLQRGFDRYYGTIHGAGSYYDPVQLTRDNEPIQADREKFYYTDAIGENACKFIDEYGGKGAPFFLYTAFTAPHWPLHALPEDIAKYKDRYKGGWDALRKERHARMIELGIVDKRWPLTPRDPAVPAWEDVADKEWQAQRMAVYAAQIDRLDQNIGRMMAKLREKNIENDTLVLFLADNGGCAEEIGPKWNQLFIPPKTRAGRPVQRGNDPKVMPGAEDTYQSYGLPWANASNTPFRLYKHWIHEGGISTPLIARWPKGIQKPNTISDQPGHLMDIMATCVDVAGATYPKQVQGNPILPMEGRTLGPVFAGKRREQPVVYWEHEGNKAVRAAKWKLVSRYPGKWELYDLEADRTELHDLAAKEPKRVTDMAKMWEAWAARANVRPWDEMKLTAR
jgi:arylsulfatase